MNFGDGVPLPEDVYMIAEKAAEDIKPMATPHYYFHNRNVIARAIVDLLEQRQNAVGATESDATPAEVV
jgi:hypothetical protein